MTGPFDPPAAAVAEAVARALAEDLGPLGDLTAALVPPARRGGGPAAVASRRACWPAGPASTRPSARSTLGIAVDVARGPTATGWRPGTTSPMVRGPLRRVLTAERTALNFLCHLSGVATLTRRFVDAAAAANPATRIWDTRKTLPGPAGPREGGGAGRRRASTIAARCPTSCS